MTTINSAEALQTSSATALKNNIDKTQQAEAMASSFAQQLATASSNVSDSGVSSAANNIINAAQSGLNLTNMTGLNSNELLTQSLKTGVQSQFTNLGNDIASSLIDAFTGQNNTISTDTEVDSSTDPATTGETETSVDAAQSATTTNSANTDSEEASTDETVTATTDEEIVDAAKAAEAQETESSSSIFPEFIQNLFADLSIFKSQNTTELTDVDTEESDTEEVNETNEEVNSTTEEKVAS